MRCTFLIDSPLNHREFGCGRRRVCASVGEFHGLRGQLIAQASFGIPCDFAKASLLRQFALQPLGCGLLELDAPLLFLRKLALERSSSQASAVNLGEQVFFLASVAVYSLAKVLVLGRNQVGVLAAHLILHRRCLPEERSQTPYLALQTG